MERRIVRGRVRRAQSRYDVASPIAVITGTRSSFTARTPCSTASANESPYLLGIASLSSINGHMNFADSSVRAMSW